MYWKTIFAQAPVFDGFFFYNFFTIFFLIWEKCFFHSPPQSCVVFLSHGVVQLEDKMSTPFGSKYTPGAGPYFPKDIEFVQKHWAPSWTAQSVFFFSDCRKWNLLLSTNYLFVAKPLVLKNCNYMCQHLRLCREWNLSLTAITFFSW